MYTSNDYLVARKFSLFSFDYSVLKNVIIETTMNFISFAVYSRIAEDFCMLLLYSRDRF